MPPAKITQVCIFSLKKVMRLNLAKSGFDLPKICDKNLFLFMLLVKF
ncbi:hypothetical protein ATCC51562_686 [Campylobacter concisus ATCC 51562]|uniref:Uncharacterized protein n=1 Tax=Campylobacter concisus ATCC 51562 TaxID=1242969 RepID=U2GGL4_9BACT|nr:hypothetical protein ATCC51562_686 [Campylobacter concisus ATCC 51562]